MQSPITLGQMLLLTSIARQQAPSSPPTLEDLAYAAGTDKSHDDHKYVDTYAALFDPIRHAVRNVTEVGIAAGQSLQMWHSYFPNALIWGLDIAIRPSAVTRTRNLSRVSMRRCNSQNPSSVMRLGWSLRSMDLIIDDGDHKPRSNEATLLLLWPFVREGGYFVTEDVATGANADGRYDGIDHTRRIGTAPAGFNSLVHNVTGWRSPGMQRILDEHDSFFVDSSVGHRAYDAYHKRLSRFYGVHAVPKQWLGVDTLNHQSHLLVIRRRVHPRTRPVLMHAGTTAMKGVLAASAATQLLNRRRPRQRRRAAA